MEDAVTHYKQIVNATTAKHDKILKRYIPRDVFLREQGSLDDGKIIYKLL
jgi:hypothetical protein